MKYEEKKLSKTQSLRVGYINSEYYCSFHRNTDQNQNPIDSIKITRLQSPPTIYEYDVRVDALKQYAQSNGSQNLQLFSMDITFNKLRLATIINIKDEKLQIKGVKNPIAYKTKEQFLPKKPSRSGLLAYMAAKIIIYLCEIEPQNFYLKKSTSIRKRILTQLFQQEGCPQLTENDRFMLEQLFNIEKITLFEQQNQLWKNAMFQHALNADRNGTSSLIFNPTFTTCQIFKFIMSPRKTKFIYGSSGIGKTISLIFLALLTSYIENFKLQVANLEEIHHFIDPIKFSRIDRIYYFNLANQNSEGGVLRNLQNNRPKTINYSTVSSFLDDFRHYYQTTIKDPPIFIVDQINIYSSLLREYARHNQAGQTLLSQADNISKSILAKKIVLIKQMLDVLSCYTIIYASSANCQQALMKDSTKMFQKLVPNSYYGVRFQEKICKWFGLLEIGNIILFEFIRMIQISKSTLTESQIELKIKNVNERFQIIFASIMRQRNQQNLQKSFLTHKKINRFLYETAFKLEQFEKLEKKQSILLDFLKEFINRISEWVIQSLKKQYFEFLSKGHPNERQVKLNFMEQLVECITESQDDSPFFQYQYSRQNAKAVISFDNINKEHAFVDQDSKKIKFFYDRQTLLKITDFSTYSVDVIQIFSNNLFLFIHSLTYLFGGMLDRIFTELVPTQTLELKIYNWRTKLPGILLIFNQKKQKITFEHFYPNETSIDLSKKFQRPINTLQSHAQYLDNNKFLAASPALKDKDNQPSPNCKVVDLAILRINPQGFPKKYSLITIDFSITKNLDKKIINAQNFYNQLMKQNLNATKTFTFQHYFISLKSSIVKATLNQTKKQKEFCQFILSPIEQMEIISNKKRDAQLWTYYQSIRNAFEQRKNKKN